MNYQCEIKEQAAQPTVSIRTRAAVQDLPQVMGQVFGEIAQYIGRAGGQFAGAPFAAYYNMDMQDLDVEIGFPVAASLPGEGRIQAGQIPGGYVATVLHVGPYDAIGPAYEALTKYIADHGYAPSGIAYEFYLTDPNEEPKQPPQTLVMFPLQVVPQPA